jgi:SAM-dependent methyltransferase
MPRVSVADLPLPPFELASRVGSLREADDPWALYDLLGRLTVRDLLAALPDGYSLDGKRVLDFGCGAGRTLRHFAAEDSGGEFWGCDIDVESIEWLNANLAPPLHAFVNSELPPLDQPDETFDLVYCVSVFTHLARSWSAWLAELHRVLKPGGLLLATFMGSGQAHLMAPDEWDEDTVGMLILHPGQSWAMGGPMVLHSEWWIREHWGRLFDVLSVTPDGFAVDQPGIGHGLVVLRKKPAALSLQELETPSADPREALALARNLDRLVRDLEDLRRAWDGASSRLDRLETERAEIVASRSWRLTRPLRHFVARARSRRDG